MKIKILTIVMLCAILAGCTSSGSKPEQPAEPTAVETKAEETVAAAVIRPLPDTTMEALENSVLNISFTQNDLYQDESGKTILRMQIYTYEKFDMVDISNMKGELAQIAKECNELGKAIGMSVYMQHEDIFNAMHNV